MYYCYRKWQNLQICSRLAHGPVPAPVCSWTESRPRSRLLVIWFSHISQMCLKSLTSCCTQRHSHIYESNVSSPPVRHLMTSRHLEFSYLGVSANIGYIGCIPLRSLHICMNVAWFGKFKNEPLWGNGDVTITPTLMCHWPCESTTVHT